jgi:hypothetical protein
MHRFSLLPWARERVSALRGTARVHAAPGKATPWRASGHFRAPHGMSCVLRGVTAR